MTVCESADPCRHCGGQGSLTAYTAGFRAGLKFAQAIIAAEPLPALSLDDAREDMSDLDHRPCARWHE